MSTDAVRQRRPTTDSLSPQPCLSHSETIRVFLYNFIHKIGFWGFRQVPIEFATCKFETSGRYSSIIPASRAIPPNSIPNSTDKQR